MYGVYVKQKIRQNLRWQHNETLCTREFGHLCLRPGKRRLIDIVLFSGWICVFWRFRASRENSREQEKTLCLSSVSQSLQVRVLFFSNNKGEAKAELSNSWNQLYFLSGRRQTFFTAWWQNRIEGGLSLMWKYFPFQVRAVPKEARKTRSPRRKTTLQVPKVRENVRVAFRSLLLVTTTCEEISSIPRLVSCSDAWCWFGRKTKTSW